MDAGHYSQSALQGNVARVYEEVVAEHPDRLALEMDGHTYTHAELRRRGARFAGGLAARRSPGDRVALYLPNCPEFVVAALGALRAGMPFVPMNPQLTPPEVAARLTDSGATVLITHADLRERVDAAIDAAAVDPLVVVAGVDDSGDVPGSNGSGDGPGSNGSGDGPESGGSADVPEPGDLVFGAVDDDPHCEPVEDDDVALQPYTSGTTGEPKGVLLTHRNLRAQSLMGFERSNLPPERERFLSVLPLAHIAGFVNRTWQPLVRGGSVYLRDPESWDPEAAMATIEREEITKFGAVTTMYVDVVEHESFGEYDLSSLEEAMEGGDGMPGPLQERFEAVADVDLFEAYGLTETGGGTHAGINSTFGTRPGTVGQPLRATDCKVVDEDGEEVPPGETGELLVRGPHVMAGYHERPEETAQAFTDEGYFRTGDVVRRDADNYYDVVDRKKHVIVTGGYTVYPREVEEALHEHPAVVDAAVVGMPDERRGETVGAYVVVDHVEVDTEALRNHCLDRLAAYKHPREISFVDRLPRTTSGKVKKFELRAESD